MAAAFTLHVVEPHLNGPAGEVPIILTPTGQAPRVLCGQGPAPAGATIEHYTRPGLGLVSGTGPPAAAVPGAFDAWMPLLRDHGTKRLSDVLAHAIWYAERGHPVLGDVRYTLSAMQNLFESEWITSATVYLRDGKPPAPGQLLKNPVPARNWRRLISEAEAAHADRKAHIETARRTWREGFITEALTATAAQPTPDTPGERHTGTPTGNDLVNYTATYEDPAAYTWKGRTIAKPGLWSQDPVFLQQPALLPEHLDHGTADYYHAPIEGSKLAMADREARYGDGTDMPLEALLSPTYNAERRAAITPEASRRLRPGSPDGRPPRVSSHAVSTVPEQFPAGVGEPTVTATRAAHGDTCHLDVVDRWGNMIAATPSGGRLDLQGAIDAPNWHQDSFPGSFYPRSMNPGGVTMESRFGAEILIELRRRGHRITMGDAWSEGRICAVARDPEAGVLSAAANPRGMQGYAAGR